MPGIMSIITRFKPHKTKQVQSNKGPPGRLTPAFLKTKFENKKVFKNEMVNICYNYPPSGGCISWGSRNTKMLIFPPAPIFVALYETHLHETINSNKSNFSGPLSFLVSLLRLL